MFPPIPINVPRLDRQRCRDLQARLAWPAGFPSVVPTSHSPGFDHRPHQRHQTGRTMAIGEVGLVAWSKSARRICSRDDGARGREGVREEWLRKWCDVAPVFARAPRTGWRPRCWSGWWCRGVVVVVEIKICQADAPPVESEPLFGHRVFA